MDLHLKLLNDPTLITAEEERVLGKAVTTAFRAGGDLLKQRGRAAIAAGGFSSRWQNAFRVNVYPKGGSSLSPHIFAFHKIRYAGQFEDPEPVLGKPYVWLPIEKNLPGGKRWTPDKYQKQIGPLRPGRHGGKPLLFGQVAVSRSGHPLKRKPRAGTAIHKTWVPLFVGVRSVNDPKRFDLVAVAERVAGELGAAVSKVLS